MAVARQRGALTADAAEQVLLLDGSGARAWAPGVASAAYAGRTGAQVVLGAPSTLPTASARWLGAASSPQPLLCAPLTSRRSCDLASAALGHTDR